MIALYNAFPDSLKDYVVAKQQFALALNRRNQPGDREKALKILDELLKNRGADSETLGIKGRVHKDIYKEAPQAKKITAIAALDDSANVYVTGHSNSSPNGDDHAIVKYDASGTEERVGRYDGPGGGGDSASGIAVDASGNVDVTGTSVGLGTNTDYATIKYVRGSPLTPTATATPTATIPSSPTPTATGSPTP